MGNDKNKDFYRLEAENKRLKRLIKRLHKGLWGIPFQDEPLDDNAEDHLLLYLSSVLVSQAPFKVRLNKVLEALGSFTEVSRIYIFENFNNSPRVRNTFEWCNDGVDPEIHNLQDVSYDDFPHWENMLEEKGIIKASNINTFPEKLKLFLQAQYIESIIAIPLIVNGKNYGFIGFDECSYNREWLPHEVDLLKVASRLISSAYETNINQAQIIKQSKEQQLLLDISRLLISNLNFSEKLNSTIEKLARHYGFDQVLIYESGDNNRFSSLTNSFCIDGQAIDDRLNILNFAQDLPGWLESFNRKGYYTSTNATLQHLSSNAFITTKPNRIITAVPIRSKQCLWGFIVTLNPKKNEDLPIEETSLHTIADMFAGTYEREDAQLRIKQNHNEILMINTELEKKEAFLHNILSSAPIGIMMIRNQKIEFINASAITSSGYSENELIGTDISNYCYKEVNKEKLVEFYNEIEDNGTSSIEVMVKNKMGEPLTYRIIGKQIPDKSEDKCYLLIADDITLIKAAEKNLQESEERNQKIIETTIDGIFIFNGSHKVVYANSPGLNMLGYNIEELRQISLNQLFNESDNYERFKLLLSNSYSGTDYIGDTKLINKTQDIIYAEIYATTIMINGQNHAYVSLHDITKRKENEKALKTSEKKFRALTDNSPDHILRISRTGTLSFCNSSFIKDYGLKLQDCLGQKLSDIDKLPHEMVDGLNNAIGDVLISKSTTPVELDYTANGQIHSFDWTITPETNDTNQLSSLLLVGRNFTLRKRAEQELIIAKEEAESADRLKSAFLANMSHEIRTPLNAIVGFTNLLNEKHISDSEKEEYIDIINNSSENLMDLINDIVDLAKIESGQMSIKLQDKNPNELLNYLFKRFEKHMQPDTQKHLKFYLQIPENTDEIGILCDLKRLEQVLNNLLSNAFKFTPKGFIEMGYTIEDNRFTFFVRDTGIGISSDKIDVIFEPFRQEDESTAKLYGGTGLGLSISKRLLEGMGSQLVLSSEKNKGTEFTFSLPVSDKRLQPIIKEKTITIENNVRETITTKTVWPDKIILLVDATSTAQLQIRKHLDQSKVTLISARTPNSARELLLKRKDIDLVLIDINMPGINAEEFIKSIRQLNINIPFIAQSVEIEQSKINSILTAGFNDILNKPIQKEELLQKISMAFKGVYRSQLN